MLNVKCPLCGAEASNGETHYAKIGLGELNCSIVCCNDCGHYFTTLFDNINTEELYSKEHYKLVDTRGTLFDKIISFDDKLILRKLSKLKMSGNKLLDFGCGKGQFIYRASQGGWNVKGIETAKERAEFGKNIYRLNISTSEYQSGLIRGGAFNVITFFHVLEHLYEPKKILREIADNNLTRDGIIVIEVPLFESLQSKIAGKNWLHLDPPLHISHFKKSTLVNILNELDLEPFNYQYFSIHLGILGMVQSIMSLFGYKKMIISELKSKRTKRLMIAICSVLPIAIFLECIAVLFKKGGILRVYCSNKK